MFKLIGVQASRLLVGLMLAACSHRAGPGEKPPASADAKRGELKKSEKFGYAWTLPQEWEFVPSDKLGRLPPSSSVEVLVARRRDTTQTIIQVIVTDLIVVPPRRTWGSPEDYDHLEEEEKQVLRDNHAQPSGARRLTMSGGDAVEVRGVLGEQEYSLRSFYRGRRRFQFRCLAPAGGDDWPCESALASFEVSNIQEEPASGDTPRVLHLRDTRFGIEFDAPDDSWLAVGPSSGGGGAQVVWVWRNGDGQIDLQAIDLSVAAGRPPDQATIATKMADDFRAKGASVRIELSTLSGAQCQHITVDRADGFQQDMFILNGAHASYAILVTQRSRSKDLLSKVRRGFRLTAK